MKVVGINGSPRKGGNTSILIETVFEELAAEGIVTVSPLPSSFDFVRASMLD